MKVMDKEEFVFMRFLLGKRGNIFLVNSAFKPYFFIQLRIDNCDEQLIY